jgi:hypothetical protein
MRRMDLLTHRPPSPLSEFVDLFWLHDGAAPQHGKERVLPTGTLELIINLRDEIVWTYDSREYSVQDLEGFLWSFGTYRPISET